jgi:voltage-gated potassium channel
VLVVGFGAQGRAAVDTLLARDVRPVDLTVVDLDRDQLDNASAHGVVTFRGDATREPVLRGAGLAEAASVVVATGRDATTALVAVHARQIAPTARIVVSARDPANVPLLERAGADTVIVPPDLVGRLLARQAAGHRRVVSG